MPRSNGIAAVFVRFLSWLVMKLLYRVTVQGRDRVPRDGPALLLCNHVSYIDGILLLAASPRNIWFLIDADFVRLPVVGWVLRLVGAVPMPRGGGPKAIRQALDSITEHLKAGNLVCVFPEGAPTRTGAMLPFRRGFERIARNAGAQIVPACIDRLWGSVWTYSGGKMYWKWPRRGSGPVRVAFGNPMPSQSTPFEVRQKVQELLSDCAKTRTRTILPIHRRFVRMAARQPFRPCLIDTTGKVRVLNYVTALVGAICISRWLKPQLGAAPMVGVWLPSSVGGVLANVALCLLRKTAVNLNYTSGEHALNSALRQCDIKHVVTSKRFLAKLALPAIEGIALIHLEDALPAIGKFQKAWNYLKVVLLPGWLLERVLGLGRHRADQLATVVFSSGSTGEPKGIMLTHQNIASNVDAFIEHARLTKQVRILGILPFFHSFGYTVTMWGPLAVGGAAIFHPDPRAAKEIGDLARTHRCTLMATTGTFLRFYIRKCGADDFKSMRLVVCGAEKLPVPLAEEFEKKFGIRPLEGYGCTELSPVVSVNMPDVEVNEVKQVCQKPGSVGHPLPGVAAKVVDAESFSDLPVGADGLVLVTGPNVMKGYLGRDDLTAKAIRDGWYITGDMGQIDDDGFITLTGRQSRFAKIGGEMVPLERLEDELHAILETSERVVAVTALPDEKRGERIVVLHLPLPRPPKALCDGLTQKGLPNLWVPGERDFFPVEQMPVLGSGKLDLQQLKKTAERIVNGQK